ncbi:hypothetical protein BREVNS_1412 [Brevinematales bacterium NS]|nr:hypothetical protein BREVNS_1412 [Brevinematales bacterium NS]
MQEYFLPVSGSGATPLKPHFFSTRAYLSFSFKKNRIVYC